MDRAFQTRVEGFFSHRALNDSFLDSLEDLFDTHRELFPVSIPDKETLRKRVQVYRTLRQTSDTWALEEKVGQTDIDVINHWKALESSGACGWEQVPLSDEAALR
jgi:hypothetical protein